MARKAREEREKEHLHWQEVFRVFTMPSILPGTTQAKVVSITSFFVLCQLNKQKENFMTNI